MRLSFGRKVIKRCPEGHELEMAWRTCPHCSGRAAHAHARDFADATIFDGAPEPRPAAEVSGGAPVPLLHLAIESGPRAGERLALFAGRTKLGKAPRPEGEAALIALGDLYMSRDHAAVVAGPGGVVLIDLGSTNGTYVNGRRVERAILGEGDELRLGQMRLRVSQPPPP